MTLQRRKELKCNCKSASVELSSLYFVFFFLSLSEFYDREMGMKQKKKNPTKKPSITPFSHYLLIVERERDRRGKETSILLS